MLSFGLMLRPGHFPLPHMLAVIKVAEGVGFDHVWYGTGATMLVPCATKGLPRLSLSLPSNHSL